MSCLTPRIFVLFACCRAAAPSASDRSGPATIPLTAVDESPVGTKQTYRSPRRMSVVEGTADKIWKCRHFRF